MTWTATPPCDLYDSERSLSTVWGQLVEDLRAGKIRAPTEILDSNGGESSSDEVVGMFF